MEKAKRARKAETPKQPSLGLKLRAPYLYPDRRHHSKPDQRLDPTRLPLADLANSAMINASCQLCKGKRLPTRSSDAAISTTRQMVK